MTFGVPPMIPLLTTTSTVMCPHGGRRMLTTTNTEALVDGAPVLLQTDHASDRRLPVHAGRRPDALRDDPLGRPARRRRRSTSVPVLLQTSVGLCFNAAQAPQGVGDRGADAATRAWDVMNSHGALQRPPSRVPVPHRHRRPHRRAGIGCRARARRAAATAADQPRRAPVPARVRRRRAQAGVRAGVRRAARRGQGAHHAGAVALARPAAHGRDDRGRRGDSTRRRRSR